MSAPVATLYSPTRALWITIRSRMRPACYDPCDPDCEAGPVHCEWVHQPNHKPGWHRHLLGLPFLRATGGR